MAKRYFLPFLLFIISIPAPAQRPKPAAVSLPPADTVLAFSMPEHETALYLVVPDAREKKVQAQLSRLAIRAAGATIRYILFSEPRQHCEVLCKFGDSPAAMRKIARSVS